MKQIVYFLLVFSMVMFAQNNELVPYTGKVTYLSSVNVYVQVESSEGINAGDTLYLEKSGKRIPAVVIEYLSSKSLAGKKISTVPLEPGALLYGLRRPITLIEVKKNKTDEFRKDSTAFQKEEFKKRNREKRGFSGRVTLNSYSDFSDYNSGNRYRTSLSLNSNNALGDKFAITTYFTFHYNDRETQSISTSLPKRLKFYDLSAIYTIDSVSQLFIGRYVNKKVVNGGATDGIQYQKTQSRLTYGFIAGSRPAFHDYSFDFKFFQVGAFLSTTDTLSGSSMESTVAFFHQTNKFKTDRDYLYLQNTNTLLPGTRIFASAEVDLYEKILSATSIKPVLTGLYIMSRTVIIQKLNLTFSYDARRNVIYYETYKSRIDSTLENELRQGLRASLNYGFGGGVNTGINWGYRFRKSDPRPSKNIGAFTSFSKLPYLDASLYASVSHFSGSYIEGLTGSGQLSKELFQILTVSAGYRYFNYNFPESSSSSTQHTLTGDLSLMLSSGFILSFSFEGVSENALSTNRIFLDCTYRF